ncbi:MAG: glycosyltransferase [Bacteroidales bacterium]|nr:glycosyltransferase [Bacteroidales bacterium]
MSTGIIILNYNNAQDTKNCILSFEQHNTAPVKYIVVDNGSTNPDTVPELDRFFSDTFSGWYSRLTDKSGKAGILSPVTFLVSAKNDGYARGNNKGLRLAFGDDTIDSILIVNNDVLFIEDIVPTLIGQTRELPNPGMVSPILYKRDGKHIDYNCARYQGGNWSIILPLYWHNHKRDKIRKFRDSEKVLLAHPEYLQAPSFQIDLPSGSCMFARKEVLQKVEGFDNGTFLYFEESILAAKLSRLGYANYCITGIHAIHLGASTTSKSNDLFLQKCMLESANRYLGKFGRMTTIQWIVWQVTRIGWWATFAFKGLLSKKDKKK